MLMSAMVPNPAANQWPVNTRKTEGSRVGQDRRRNRREGVGGGAGRGGAVHTNKDRELPGRRSSGGRHTRLR